jgi:formylglycine-generating enzyme required for sulfatase activity
MNRILSTFLIAAFCSGKLHADPLVQIEMRHVGNAGNRADVTTGYGAVGYEFRIGKFEITVSEYAVFLNAVAASDPHGLYNPAMASDLNIAGIARTGEPGSYVYSVIGSPRRPVSYVSWFDAARFCNWLQHGAGKGANTEQGAYALNGEVRRAIAKNPGARWWIPSENEWYKAAYYHPAPEGGGGYRLYPTGANTPPGNRIGAVPGHANYMTSVLSATQKPAKSPTLNYLTDVGSYGGSATFYGTFDQAGNVWEWIDVPMKSWRGLRGGGWNGPKKYLPSSFRHGPYPPKGELPEVGLRVAGAVNQPKPNPQVP